MSNKKKRKVFTKEFKQETAHLVADGGQKASQLARDLSINRSTIDRWVREYKASGADAFPGNGKLLPEAEEYRRLKRENAALKEERDILKKAWAIFSRTSK